MKSKIFGQHVSAFVGSVNGAAQRDAPTGQKCARSRACFGRQRKR